MLNKKTNNPANYISDELTMLLFLEGNEVRGRLLLNDVASPFGKRLTKLML